MITLILIATALYLAGLLCFYMILYSFKDVTRPRIGAMIFFTLNASWLLGAAIALTVKLFKDYA